VIYSIADLGIKVVMASNDVWLKKLGLQTDDDIIATGWIPFNKYHNIYAMADLSLAPLVDNGYNRCKSELRAVLAGAWGVPTVCSAVAPYLRFTNGNQIIVTPERQQGWMNAIMSFFDDNCHKNPYPKLVADIRDNYDIVNINRLREGWWSRLWD
jgi:glycosyltransferase involved in cell wall biosynthesis